MSGAATRSRTRPRIERAVKPQHDSAEIAAIHAKLKELEALIKSMAGADGKDGKDGKGATKMGRQNGAKDYTDPKVQAEMKDEDAFKAIRSGMKENGKEKMKPYGGELSDEEIRALVAYMRAFNK